MCLNDIQPDDTRTVNSLRYTVDR